MRVFHIIYTGIFLTTISQGLVAQELFEQALAGGEKESLKISGFTRGTWFGNLEGSDPVSSQSLFAQTGLTMEAYAGSWGKAYSDIRFRSGLEYGERIREMDIREAYVDLKWSFASFRFGKQIISWGRADGINPTDVLTPVNYFYRSADPDDRRLGNYAVSLNLQPWSFIRLELDYLPLYQHSSFRFDLIQLTDWISVLPVIQPQNRLSNATWAGKLDLVFSLAEGSISWVDGYGLLPALHPVNLTLPPNDPFSLDLAPVVFRQQVLGADFACFIGKTGIRGELAWSRPSVADSAYSTLPLPEWSGVISLDRSIGNAHLVLAYSGKLVEEFNPLEPPDLTDLSWLADPNYWPLIEPMTQQYLTYANRILFDQTDEVIHTLLFRPSINLFHETLNLEATGMYNLTTEEYLLWPMVSWKPTDGLKMSLGYQYYHGKKNTRFSWIAEILNGPYFEVRITF